MRNKWFLCKFIQRRELWFLRSLWLRVYRGVGIFEILKDPACFFNFILDTR